MAGHIASVLVGVTLILLAPQLARGKHRAWQAAVVLFALGVVVHVIKGPHPIMVVYTLAMLIALLATRDVVPRAPDAGSLLTVSASCRPTSRSRSASASSTLLLEQEHVTEQLTAGGILRAVAAGLIGLDGALRVHRRVLRDFFPAALLALGIAGLVAFSVLLFRAVARRDAPSDGRPRARALGSCAYGSDTLDYFALRRRQELLLLLRRRGDDRLHLHRAATRWPSGDPIGPPGLDRARWSTSSWPCAASAAWRVAFLAVRESDASLYVAAACTTVYLGDEAIVRCDRFTLQGQE